MKRGASLFLCLFLCASVFAWPSHAADAKYCLTKKGQHHCQTSAPLEDFRILLLGAVSDSAEENLSARIDLYLRQSLIDLSVDEASITYIPMPEDFLSSFTYWVLGSRQKQLLNQGHREALRLAVEQEADLVVWAELRQIKQRKEDNYIFQPFVSLNYKRNSNFDRWSLGHQNLPENKSDTFNLLGFTKIKFPSVKLDGRALDLIQLSAGCSYREGDCPGEVGLYSKASYFETPNEFETFGKTLDVSGFVESGFVPINSTSYGARFLRTQDIVADPVYLIGRELTMQSQLRAGPGSSYQVTRELKEVNRHNLGHCDKPEGGDDWCFVLQEDGIGWVEAKNYMRSGYFDHLWLAASLYHFGMSNFEHAYLQSSTYARIADSSFTDIAIAHRMAAISQVLLAGESAKSNQIDLAREEITLSLQEAPYSAQTKFAESVIQLIDEAKVQNVSKLLADAKKLDPLNRNISTIHEFVNAQD